MKIKEILENELKDVKIASKMIINLIIVFISGIFLSITALLINLIVLSSNDILLLKNIGYFYIGELICGVIFIIWGMIFILKPIK